MVDNNTDVIKMTDRGVEKVSSSRVLLTDKPQTQKVFEEILKPTAIDGDKSEGATEDDVNMRGIVAGDDEEDEMVI